MKKNDAIRKVVIAALFAALSCVATLIVKIPTPMKGYINLGDCIVLVAGWAFSPFVAFFAVGLGSALADIFLGYIIYAPATFVIKTAMAFLTYFVSKALGKRAHSLFAKTTSGFLAELLMAAGYFVFEGFLYGFGASLVNIPANALQGAVCLVLGILLSEALKKTKIKF